MRKIRVLHIQETLGPGGVERRRLSLAKLLNRDRFEQKIICTQIQFTLVDQIRSEGVEVIPIGLLKHPFQWSQHKKVQQIIEEYQPDIIHGAVFEGVTMAAINGFIKRVPIVIIEETSDPTNRSWKGNLLVRFFGYISDLAIGVSPASVTYLKNVAKIRKSKVRLVNNGVKIPRNVKDDEIISLRKKLGLNDNDIIIGTVGRMISDKNKRFSDLIKAVAILIKDDSSIKLLMVGDGSERKRYEMLAEELGVSNNIIFAGFQVDTAPFYEIMDVFSLVSAHESFGLVLAEAMLHNLPVVASRVGGMKYIVDDTNTGFLVDRYDVTDLASKLKKLALSAHLRRQMGELGYQRAMENYIESIYVRNVESLYEELINKKEIKV